MDRLTGILIGRSLLARILRPGTKLTLVLPSTTHGRAVMATRTVIFSDGEWITVMDNGSYIQLEPSDAIELYDDGFIIRAPNGIEVEYLWDHVQV